MDNNNQQNINAAPEQAPINPMPSTPTKKLSNKIIAIIILAMSAGVVSWVAVSRQPKQDLSTVAINHKPITTNARSLDELNFLYTQAHTKGDVNAALNLVYMGGMTEEKKVSIKEDLAETFKHPLDSAQITNPDNDNFYRYTHNGITYHENLPIVKYLVVKYKAAGNPAFLSHTYGIGEYNGNYYIVTAVPIDKTVQSNAAGQSKLLQYTDNEYHFSFQFPAELKVVFDRRTENAFLLAVVGDQNTSITLTINGPAVPVGAMQETEMQSTKINNISMRKRVIIDPFIGNPPFQNQEIIYDFSHGGNTFTWWAILRKDDATNKSRMDEIINSFKFND